MAALRRWLAVLTGTVAGMLLSGAAWASRSPGVVLVLDEAARRRRGVGGFGLLGAFCCLAVVALVLVAVLLIARGRRGRGGPG